MCLSGLRARHIGRGMPLPQNPGSCSIRYDRLRGAPVGLEVQIWLDEPHCQHCDSVNVITFGIKHPTYDASLPRLSEAADVEIAQDRDGDAEFYLRLVRRGRLRSTS